MTCGHSSTELLEVFETHVSLLDGVRTARAGQNWRAALMLQADQQRLAAFESWRRHLSQPSQLSIQRTGNYVAIQYGSIVRVVPSSMLRSSRPARFIAEILWDGEHPKPKLEESVEAWNGARPGGVDNLAADIAKWMAEEAGHPAG